jgi:hypothetical protein
MVAWRPPKQVALIPKPCYYKNIRNGDRDEQANGKVDQQVAHGVC